jgi:hypothetical protein
MFERMSRHFAILTMIIAWLIYGAMPALADCPICDSEMVTQMVSETVPSHAMHDMGGMERHGTVQTKNHGNNPCSGDMAHVSFCAACLIVPPSIAIDSGRQLAFAYPAPALSHPLRDNRPVPVAPPPRFT